MAQHGLVLKGRVGLQLSQLVKTMWRVVLNEQTLSCYWEEKPESDLNNWRVCQELRRLLRTASPV